ncbi:hypothetical protein FDW84_11215 [Pseudarthrobacter sp. NamE5]|nr:hypothetical protein FDW84_11215 [Pseudarthrobacter sp. NamE5]
MVGAGVAGIVAGLPLSPARGQGRVAGGLDAHTP